MNSIPKPNEHTLLNAVLENNDMLIFVLDSEGRICRFNRACERISGYQFDEVNGQYIWDCAFVPNDDDSCSQPAFTALKAGNSDKSQTAGRIWIHKNGERRLINWNRILSRDSSGEVEFVVVMGTDVTRDRVMIEAMQAREAEAFALFEQAAVGIAYIAPDGRIIDVNPRLCEIVGYDYDAILKTTFLAITHPDDMEISRDCMARILRNEIRTFSIDKRYLRPDGTMVWVNLTVSLVRYTDGSPNYFISLTHDITPRKTAESLLRQSERQLREAQRITHLGSWELDLAADNLHWSDEIYRIFEIDKEKFGASYAAFLDAIHPDDRDAVNTAYMRSLEDKTPYEITHRLLMPDGRIKWVSERCESSFDTAGKPIRSLGTIQDISEQILIEQELRELNQSLEQRVNERTAELAEERNFISTILDTISALVVVLDNQGCIVSVNRACEELLGYRQAELEGRFSWDVLVSDSLREVMHQVFEAYSRGDELLPYEVDWCGKDGVEHTIARTNTVLRNPEGKLEYIIMTGIDITERKAAEQKMIEARDKAEQASRAKSELLSRMSHELRTPLNAILGFSQLLETDKVSPLNPVQHENINEILVAGHHLLALINEILDVSRIEAGRLSMKMESVALPSVLHDCMRLMQSEAEQRNIQLQLEPMEQEIQQVHADATRLKQVMLNLLSNAIKYNCEQGQVSIECSRHSDDYIRIAISDTGGGIHAEQQALLFTPFERLDADSKAIPGTGIGLALSKQLTELMGGSIGLDSEVGKGSTFWIKLKSPTH